MWADSLKTEEVVGTLSAVDQLSGVAWAAPLLSQTGPIVDRLRTGVADREAYCANPLQPSDMSFLFEIRFARALADVGLSAQYEHIAGVGNSTVDFRVDLDPPWLVELVSLHESEAFKAASWKSGVMAGFVLSTSADDPRQSEEGETLKAQERIGAKAFDRKQGPIKFPEPNGAIHMVMVDARGYLGDGHGDEADWSQIAFGPHGLDTHLIKHWTNPKTGERAPIMGLFQPDCPLLAAPTLQSRVHFVGFVCESTFAAGEIKQRAFYCCNPALFSDEHAAKAAMSHWPLRRNAP
jgi:hypothetical protein